ncbi:hypothetical protein [Rhizorhabdus sp.]|uniref:hypothetical protein n=1 Tax=Rhizorhabdus sp. TaxID=1968843 RepID=UPI0025D94D35|nr:hypothetical protein [Rhizorhabdus sp.]
MEVFPFKPGDWVAEPGTERVAKVKSVYEGAPGEVLLDLVIFSDKGDKLGRTSPICGGPRTFEPACSAQWWERIEEPRFPIQMKWVPNGKGGSTLQRWAGKRLPPANWRKPARRAGIILIPPDDEFRKALETIAAGHNDARALAAEVLARRASRR